MPYTAIDITSLLMTCELDLVRPGQSQPQPQFPQPHRHSHASADAKPTHLSNGIISLMTVRFPFILYPRLSPPHAAHASAGSPFPHSPKQATRMPAPAHILTRRTGPRRKMPDLLGQQRQGRMGLAGQELLLVRHLLRVSCCVRSANWRSGESFCMRFTRFQQGF